MRRSFRHLVACMLAIAYALIGLTGEGLYYWFEARRTASESAGVQGNSAGYFHRHGHGQHWHYHAPVRSRPNDARASSSSRARERDWATAFRSLPQQHAAHSCDLLAVVGAMKVGVAGGSQIAVVLDDMVHSVAPQRPILVQAAIGCAAARGPPPALAV